MTFDEQNNFSYPDSEYPKTRNTKPKKGKRTKRARVITLVVILLLVLLILVGGGTLLLNWRAFEEKSPNVQLPTDPNVAITTEPANLEDPYENFLICGVDNSENLTDIILVVCYNFENNTADILQIPRDTIVDPKYQTGGTNKINGVYGNGAEGSRKIDVLKTCLYDQLGIQIDHYALLTLEGFREMVDAFGGIEVTLDRALSVDDPYTYQPIYLKKGVNLLDGASAEGFIRSRRHYVEGDIGRLKAQRKFYVSFASKVLGLSGTGMVSMATKVYSDFSTDLTVGEIIKYGNVVRKNLNINDVHIYILPGESTDYKGYSCWSVHADEYTELYNRILNPEGRPFSSEDVGAPEVANRYPFEDTGASFGELLEEQQQQES